MKIGYWLGNVSMLNGGVAPYAWGVLELLLKNSKNNDLEIMVLCSDSVQGECLELINLYQAQVKVSIITKKFNFAERLVRLLGVVLAKVFIGKKIEKQFLRFNPLYRWYTNLDIDLLYIPFQIPPLFDLPYPFVVTMHDVQELHFPEFFTPEERAYRAEYFWKSLTYASAIVVSFEHIKQDLIKYFRLESSKIHICPLPYDQIKIAEPTKEQSNFYSNKYRDKKEFVLYPAQTWEHKNHLSLIKAVEQIKERYHRSIHVVCTGKINISFFSVIEKHLETSLITEYIHFMDIVPETELCWLYKNSFLVVIPTLYEAGSFPLIEAMSLDVPVICSNVTSLPDTISDQRFIFDPLDVEQISKLIVKFLDDKELSFQNIKNSRKRIDQLKILDTYSCILNVITGLSAKDNL